MKDTKSNFKPPHEDPGMLLGKSYLLSILRDVLRDVLRVILRVILKFILRVILRVILAQFYSRFILPGKSYTNRGHALCC